MVIERCLLLWRISLLLFFLSLFSNGRQLAVKENSIDDVFFFLISCLFAHFEWEGERGIKTDALYEDEHRNILLLLLHSSITTRIIEAKSEMVIYFFFLKKKLLSVCRI